MEASGKPRERRWLGVVYCDKILRATDTPRYNTVLEGRSCSCRAAETAEIAAGIAEIAAVGAVSPRQ